MTAAIYARTTTYASERDMGACLLISCLEGSDVWPQPGISSERALVGYRETMSRKRVFLRGERMNVTHPGVVALQALTTGLMCYII